MADGDSIPVDDPERRAFAELDRAGVPSGFFGGLYRDAAAHAADPARADPDTLDLPWVAMGPRNIGGRIRTMAQDPINPATVYAGSAFGGLWKTQNGGDTWRPLGSFLQGAANKELAPPIGAVGLCHRTPDTVYVGTGEPVPYQFPGIGLYLSSDGGSTFQQIDDPNLGPVRAQRFERILVDPWEPGRAWIACETGLWRSTPGAPPTFTDNDHVTVSPLAPPLPPAPRQDVTEVAIDFGDRSAAAPPGPYTVYTAIRGDGIYRAAYDPATNAYLDLAAANHPFREASAAADVKWKKLSGPFPGAITDPDLLFQGKGRIKLALCEHHPHHVYAVFCLKDSKASRVFASTDGGTSWRKTASRPRDDGEQANYDLVLEVHPDRPEIVVVGIVDLFRTVNGGESWEKILNWNNYDLGDRAQHADQHAVLFDRADPRAVWVGNDGGIAFSRNLGGSWRSRSHGILAVQFYDVTVHPTYPHVTGGGFQDNGSWVGFGGPTWHRLSGGDGGAMAFQHDDPYLMLTTWQGKDGSRRSLIRISLSARTETDIAQIGRGLFDFRALYDFQQSFLPDVPGTGANGGPPFLRLVAENKDVTSGFRSSHRGVFGGKLEGHPTARNHWIMARQGAAYVSKAGTTLESSNGPEFEKLALPDFQEHAPAGHTGEIKVKVSAIAYAPSAPDSEWWIGTSRGEVFFTTDGGATWSASVAPASAPDDLRGAWIGDISVHPANSSIVAIAVGRSFRNIYISGDQGANWRQVRGVTAADQLFGGPLTSVVIDPRGPAGTGPGDLQTLYVGTLTGIYVSRNVTPDVGGPAPVWRTLNTEMPLLLVRDIDYGQVRDAGGAVVRRFLRAATYGRGAYELDLGPAALGPLAGPTTPRVRLLIRSTVIDDGHRYEGAARLADDPRLKDHATGNPTPLQPHKAFDVRVDAPPFSFFERELDGVEFDEELRCDTLFNGERNFVYVQVHNTGFAVANDVFVHLYFADAAGTPPTAPDLDAAFWGGFPAPPAPGAVWRKAGEVRLDHVGPAQPRVAPFDWTPPIELGEAVALLALCTQAIDDDLGATNTGNLAVDPQTHADAALPLEERRAALRIVEARRFVPRLNVRDAVDDAGTAGAVAWGGRSADLVVVQAAVADPAATFADIADPRTQDILAGKGTGAGDALNFVYVRVFNRSAVPLSPLVELWLVAYDRLASPAEWVPVDDGAGNARLPVDDIAPHGSKFSGAFQLTNPPDPAPGRDYKAALLVALVGTADEPPPDKSAITDLDSFWRFFLAEENATRAAFRGLRYVPQA